jgi:flagellar biosynthesis/type III secretory pathway ATPase
VPVSRTETESKDVHEKQNGHVQATNTVMSMNGLLDRNFGRYLDVPRQVKDGAKVSKKERTQVIRTYERAKRSRSAMTLAMSMAAVDGPLPIGDAVAVGMLAGYGVYEAVLAFREVVELLR